MTKSKNHRVRIAAVLTAAIFGITNTGLAQTPVPMTLDQKSAVGIILPADFKIPETLGSIQARFSDNVPGKPFVIIVQDAHGIVDAQNNIQKIIAHLQAAYGLNLIAIEGGDGRLDPTLFRTFPDEFVKKKIMDGYLRRGELTGSEMAAIFNPSEGLYHGIEDWNLYEENYFAYLRATQKKERILEGLKAARESLDKERLKVYASKLNEFHEQTGKFETENTYLPQLLKFLGSFEGTRERLAQYSEIEKLFQSLEFEAESSEKQGDLDAAIRPMAEAFKTKYLDRMTTQQAMVFHKYHQDFLTGQSDPAHFLQYLVNTGKSFGLKAKLTPSLARLLGHSQTLAAIKGTRLFDELESLLTEVENTLISTPEERELAKKYRHLNLLRDLAMLELTRHQWEELQALSDKRSAVRKETTNSFSLNAYPLSLTTDFQPALEFYRLALERDKAFRKNLAGLLKKEKSKTALVLAGGFHSQGLEQSLKEEGYSYAVITPKIQSLEGQETYADVMQGKGISYKPYLKTTFYDAFVKDASIRLASEFNEPEFRQKIRAWRDGVIRQLAKEGRITETKDYTRYIDLVWKVYYDKFTNENFRPNARQEILRAIEKELKNFRHEFLENFRPQLGPPQALQTHAVMNLTRESTPRLVAVVLNPSELSPLGRSELRASSDIRTTVTALINTVFQNSSGAEVLNEKFARFSEGLLKGQNAASRQTRVNFVNFHNTLLRSLRQGSVNRRQFFDILNQVFSFTPGTPSGNLDSVLTRTQTIEQNGRQVYTLETFYTALAQTLLAYGLKTPAGWSNPYQTGLNESGEQRNQFGKLNQYFSAGLPAREVLRILADVKAAPHENRIEAFEGKLAEMQRRFETAPTRINKRLGETQIPDTRATIIRQGGATMRITGAVTNTGNSSPTMAPQVQNTIRPRSQAPVSDIPPVMRQVYEKLNLRIPDNFQEPEDSIFSRVIPTGDSLFETPSEARKRQERDNAFRAEVQAARDEVLKDLNKPPAKSALAKQKARSEVRGGITASAREALERRRREREEKRNNSALLSMIEGGGPAAPRQKIGMVPVQTDLSGSIEVRRGEITRKLYRMYDEVEIPIVRQIARLQDAIRKKESDIESRTLYELRRELQAAKGRLDAQRIESGKRRLREEELEKEIALEKSISQIQFEIEREKEKLERPDALKSLDKELEAKNQELGNVRLQLGALEEELKSLPERMKLIEAAQKARDAVLSKLNLPRSEEPSARSELRTPQSLNSIGSRAEVRVEDSAAETSEEPEALGHILGEPDEEGWLLSEDEERLFELIVTSRKIRDIYEKLEQGQTVTRDDLKLVLKWLKLGNPLAMILGERLQGGDWVVNWQVSGVGEGENEGGLGVKQFNNPELLGEQGYNDFKFKTLVKIIEEEMERFFTEQFGEVPKGQKDQQYTRALYDDFKVDVRIVKPQVSGKLAGFTHEEFKKLLNEVELRIKRRATEELKKLLEGKEQTLSRKEYGEIDFKKAVNLLAIKVGLSQVDKFNPEEEPQRKAQARLEAVIHSTFARTLPDGIYNRENYKEFVRETIDLRNSLNQEGVLKNIFTDYTLEYTDSKGKEQKYTERVIDKKFAIHLRKKTAFEKLPDEMKKAFKSEELYKRAQAFFNRLSGQDYFIRWPLEFDKAAAEGHKILKVIQYLYQNISAGIGITANNRPIVRDIIQKYILNDARNRGVTSPVDFHGRSPPMKGTPVYVSMDVIDLGPEVATVLTAQLGLINDLIQEEKWDEVGAIQRNSGGPIVDKKLKMQKAIQDTYERVLEEEAETRPLLMHVGGDEVVLVFNTKGLSPDLLNILWFEIRRAVSKIGFQIRIGIEADASEYRKDYGEGIKNADNFAHMRALKTSDPLTEISKGVEDGVKDGRLGPEFENVLAIHQDRKFVIRIETKEGIRDYTQSEVQTMLAGGQELADFNAAQAAAVANLTTDEKVREVADPVASALTHAVLNAGATEKEALAANEILAQALAGAVTAKTLNPEAIQKLGKLIAQGLSNRDEKQHLGKLIAALFMKSGKYPVPENVKEVRNVMQAAIDNAFEVRSLFSAEEVEEGRKKYQDHPDELKAFLAKGWEQNRSVMDNAAVSNWYLAIRLMMLRPQPHLKIAPPKIVPQTASPAGLAAFAARSELRRIIRGSKEMMEWLSRGQSVEGIVRKIFAEEIYGEAEQLGLGEGPQTVLLVDTIRGTVVWELAKLTGRVSVGETAFEPSAGYKSITARALFLLDHPELLQKMLAKSNPSADIWGRGLRLYDGALIAPIEDAVRHKEDKAHIENQLQWTTVVIAFQVGTEKKIIDILRIPGVIPLALKDDTGDLAKVGGHFEDIRMTLASGTRIKSRRIREGAAGIVYYNRLAAYLRQSNLSLARLARLSDLALSSEEIKSKMRVQDGAHVMTPEAFNMLVDYVERLALDQEVQTTYETAA